PSVAYSDSRIVYHTVSFPPPSQERKHRVPVPLTRRDKGTKRIAGFLRALEFQPEYVVLFDGDDVINRRLVEYVHRCAGGAGWYVDKGYTLDLERMRIQRKGGLVR